VAAGPFRRRHGARPRRAAIVALVTTSGDCYTCAQEAGAADLPPRERIAADDLWRVAHAVNSAVPGWLVLLPRRHVTAVADLTDAEAQALGTWQVRLSRALHQVLGCQKTYIAQFAEAAGFAHVHFHVVARPPDLAPELRGPRVFGLLGPADRPPVSSERMDEIALGVAAVLAGAPGRP
jgi:diadenosine tetraphosphate (Ap4A) HIT family hydrolase